mmetsp:Transcript_27190/g.63290  ORF Transcript_27190/g.63290 Transcript_27190/m.63290 type:complete len:644 (+) Transcript_27190:36-1967(+)
MGTSEDGALALADAAPLFLRHSSSLLLTLGDVSQCPCVCKHWHALSKSDEWVKQCVLHGNVNSAERRGLWGRLAGVTHLQDRWCAKLIREAVPGLNGKAINSDRSFEVLASHPLPNGKLAEIERDVHRTLPTHPRFKGEAGSAGRQDMLKVLRATAVAEPGVGYCQGMNFVAAVLLITLGSAHDAFWMLLALLDGYHYRRIFAPGVPLLPLRIFQFSGLVRERLPKLWRHLHFESSSIEIFAHQCVMTLFAYSIEPGILAQVWDVFFLLGWQAVFRVGLGLLAKLEPKLLSMDIEQISVFLHQCKRHVELPKDPAKGETTSVQEVLASLLQFEVSGGSLEDLERSFQEERWQQLLKLAASASGGLQERLPLPTGIERAAGGEGISLDVNALRSENRPPWQCRSKADGKNVNGDDVEDEEASPLPVVISMDDLRALRRELEELDVQTKSDAVTFQERVRRAEKALQEVEHIAKPLQEEATGLTQACVEGRLRKQALIETLQVAVKTSTFVRKSPQSEVETPETGADEEAPASDTEPPQRTDEVVVECQLKLNRLESELFDQTKRLHELSERLTPISEELVDLRENKVRAMSQLQTFLSERQQQRSQRLAEGMQELLSAAMTKERSVAGTDSCGVDSIGLRGLSP